MRNPCIGPICICLTASLASAGWATTISNPGFGLAPFDYGAAIDFDVDNSPFDGPGARQGSLISDVDLSGSEVSGDANVSYDISAASGSLKTFAQVTGSNRSAAFVSASLYDVLTFDFGSASSGLVTLSFSTDGSISGVPGVFGSSATQMLLADVTGLPTPFFLDGFVSGPGQIAINSATRDVIDLGGGQILEFTSPSLLVDQRGYSEIDNSVGCPPVFDVCSSVPSNGTPLIVDYILEGTFLAETGREYALLLSTTSSVIGEGSAISDFFSTSVFAITDTSGGIAFSASGILPGTTAVPAPIPLPASLPVLLSALGCIALLRNRRKKSQVI